MKSIITVAAFVVLYVISLVFRDELPIFYLIMQLLVSLVILAILFLAGLIIFAIVALLFFKDSFTHKPGEKKFAWLVQVEKNRQTIIDREGHPLRTITGGFRKSRDEIKKEEEEDRPKSPVLHELLSKVFTWYERLAFDLTGLYAYVPYYTEPRIYPLPRLEIDPDGKLVIIKPDNVKYLSNHVRNALTTWFFEYRGIDIQTMPFKVTGSINYRIDPEKTVEALYRSDSWNILMDQVCSAIMRSYLKTNGTIDKVLGRPSEELYGEDIDSSMNTDAMAKATCEEILGTVLETIGEGEEVENKKLSDFGIIIASIKIVDISPDFSDEEELQALRSAPIGKARGRGIALGGKGEAAAQQSILDVHKNNQDKEISTAIIQGRALESASSAGSTIDALLATFAQSKQKDNLTKK